MAPASRSVSARYSDWTSPFSSASRARSSVAPGVGEAVAAVAAGRCPTVSTWGLRANETDASATVGPVLAAWMRTLGASRASTSPATGCAGAARATITGSAGSRVSVWNSQADGIQGAASARASGVAFPRTIARSNSAAEAATASDPPSVLGAFTPGDASASISGRSEAGRLARSGLSAAVSARRRRGGITGERGTSAAGPRPSLDSSTSREAPRVP